MTDEEWDLVLDVSLRGTFNVCRSAARLLRRKDAPHNRKVVNMASINGIYGVAFNANYSAAKAGVIGLTKALPREWAHLQINVNAVAPGYIEGTRLTAPASEGDELGIPARGRRHRPGADSDRPTGARPRTSPRRWRSSARPIPTTSPARSSRSTAGW